jgi:hypothetical protein
LHTGIVEGSQHPVEERQFFGGNLGDHIPYNLTYHQ